MGVGSFFTSKLDEAIGWARKYSIFQYPFVTACCGMEYMATACSHYDIDRFGAGLPRFSPRQADVLFVVGTISHKMAIVENLIAKRPSASSIGSLPHSNGSAFTGVSRRGASRLGRSTSAPATRAEMAKTMSIGA